MEALVIGVGVVVLPGCPVQKPFEIAPLLLYCNFPLVEGGPVVLDISVKGGFVEVLKGDVGIPVLYMALDDIQGFLGGYGPQVVDIFLTYELLEAVEEGGG